VRSTFIDTLMVRAATDPQVFLITADMGFSVFEQFAEEHPDRFLNVGVAEQNAVGVGAGLALDGYNVFVYSIAPFVTMRCFEQVRLDVAYMNTNVKLVGVGGGLSYGPGGATHHAIEDVSLMRSLPNMRVCCPGDPHEARKLVEYSFDHPGPMYIRLAKNREPIFHQPTDEIVFGKAFVMREGTSFALISTGHTLDLGTEWVKQWVAEGYDPTYLSMHTVKPLDVDTVSRLVRSNTNIITLEEHNTIGGLGSAVAEVASGIRSSSIVVRVGISDVFSHYVGSHHVLRDHFGISRRPDPRELGIC
jgi:transketolase